MVCLTLDWFRCARVDNTFAQVKIKESALSSEWDIEKNLKSLKNNDNYLNNVPILFALLDISCVQDLHRLPVSYSVTARLNQKAPARPSYLMQWRHDLGVEHMSMLMVEWFHLILSAADREMSGVCY